MAELLDRRRFFTLAGSGAVALVGLASATKGQPVPSDRIVGRFQKLTTETSFELLTPTGTAEVIVTDQTALWRGKDRVSLRDYIPGDDLTVAGQGALDYYHADEVETLYRALRAGIQERHSDRLITPEGTFRLTGSTRPSEAIDERGRRYAPRPVAEIRAGDEVVAWARYEPREDVFVVIEIATAAREP